MWRLAYRVLQTGGPGDGDANPLARNTAISRAYADFYQREPKLEWAGIAAIVSSNAGCAMRRATAVHADAERESRDRVDTQRYVVPPGEGASGVAHEALAKGNKAIFHDIYPRSACTSATATRA